MLQVLNPIWLFAIGGIAIPLIIHLWNVKKGKTLKVGSISLLGESSRQRAKSLKLIDLLLLFLRCLLIILLAFILAKPFWNSQKKNEENSAWILIEEENSKEIYSKFKAEIDSLSQLGYDLRIFEPNFREIKIGEIQEGQISDKKIEIPSYWSLLNLLDKKIPANTKAFLYTGNQLRKLGNKRAEISFPLKWKSITPKDSTSSWVENAWFQESGNISVNIANSSPTGTIYKTETFDPTIKNPQFSLNLDEGIAKLIYKNSKNRDSNSIIIDTSSINIAIFSDKYKYDANYLKAAINAIKLYTSRKLVIKEYFTKNIPAGQNIIFWLSDSPVPNQIIPKNTLFIYKSGEIQNVNTILKIGLNSTGADINLSKRIKGSANEKDGISLWEDGFGNPILSRQEGKTFDKLEFYSRFNPDWNDLVWSDEFPKALINIVLQNQNSLKIHELDKRKISDKQMSPIYIKEEKVNLDQKSSNGKSLEEQFWLALILIFMLERYLSFRNNLA